MKRRWLSLGAAASATAGLFAASTDVGRALMGVQKWPCELAVAAVAVALLVLAVRKAS